MAFGDCQNFRVIFHWKPASSEEYAQESGRAGHDNLTSKAVLLFGNPC